MSTLLERLEAIATHDYRISFLAHIPDTASEAAATIRQLQAENERLRGGLEHIAGDERPDHGAHCDCSACVAAALLTPAQEGEG